MEIVAPKKSCFMIDELIGNSRKSEHDQNCLMAADNDAHETNMQLSSATGSISPVIVSASSASTVLFNLKRQHDTLSSWLTRGCTDQHHATLSGSSAGRFAVPRLRSPESGAFHVFRRHLLDIDLQLAHRTGKLPKCFCFVSHSRKTWPRVTVFRLRTGYVLDVGLTIEFLTTLLPSRIFSDVEVVCFMQFLEQVGIG